MNRLRHTLDHPLARALYLPALLYAAANGLLVPILPLYAAEFDISYWLIGLVLAAEGLGTLAGDVPAGLLIPRLGIKRVMLLGVAGAALATVALFGAQSIVVVLVLRLAAGLCRALFGVAQHAYLSEVVPATQRGKAIALFGGTFRTGQLIGPVLSGVLADAAGLRAPFLLYGGLGGLALLALIRWMHHTPRHDPHFIDQPHGGASLRAALRARRRMLLTGGLGQFGAQMTRAGWSALIPLYGADILKLGVGAIGLIIGLMRLIDMSLFYPTGLIMDRLGRKWAIVPSFAIQSVGMALIPLTGGFAGLLAASCVIGLGNGLGAGTMMTLGADVAPEEGRGEFLGVWRLIGDAGATSGPLVAGGVADALILPAAVLAIAGIGLTTTLLFTYFVPETLRRPAQPASQSSV